jgi:serine/threonine protein kinase
VGQATERLVGGRYALIQSIGRGGMGVVWRARDTLLEREVAVKEIHFPPGTTEDERRVLRTRVFREARAAARLSHPSVVTVYDVIEEDDQPFIVMELVDAPSLADVVRDRGALAPAVAAKVGLDILSALEVAHAAGVIHRDIKPGNVMVRTEGHAELADFGIASVKDDPSVTSTGLVLGSPAYMAPEQASQGVTSPASDLWSLGATLYFAVEGSPAFEGDGALPTLTAVLHNEPRPMRTAGAMSPLLSRLLDKDPARRPQHAEVRRYLEDAASGAAAAASTLAATAAATRVHPYPNEPAPADDTMQLVRPSQLGRSAPLDAGVVHQAARPAARRIAAGGADGRDYDGRGRGSGWPVVFGLLVAVLALAVGAFAIQSLTSDDDGDTDRTSRGVTSSPSPSAAGTSPTKATKAAAAPKATPTPTAGKASVTAAPVNTPKPTTKSTPTPTPEPTPAPTPTPTPKAATSSPAVEPATAGVPASWVTYRHPSTGFTIKHPPNWTIERSGLRTTFRAPDRSARMLVEYTTTPGDDPDGAWRANEPSVAANQRNYERIRIDPTTYKGYDAGIWEFTYDSSSGTRMRTANLGFVTDDYGFALLYSTPESIWSQSQGAYDDFKASFRPPPGQ